MSSGQEEQRLESIDLEDHEKTPPVDNKPSCNEKASLWIMDALSSITGIILIVFFGIYLLVVGAFFLNDCEPGLSLTIGFMALGAAILVSATYLPIYRSAKSKCIAAGAPLRLEQIHKRTPCNIQKLYYNTLLMLFAAHSFIGFRIFKRLTSKIGKNQYCIPPVYWTGIVLFGIYAFFFVLCLFGCVILCFGRCCCPKTVRKCCGGTEKKNRATDV